MDDKLLKTLAILTAGYITVNSIYHPGGEDPHTHNDYANVIQYENPMNSSATVSGTPLGRPLNDLIIDLGKNPQNSAENIYKIIIPNSMLKK